MVGGAAVEVPAVEHVFAAVVQERACSGLADVDVGLGAESAVRVQLEVAVGEEEGRVAIIGLRDMRCSRRARIEARGSPLPSYRGGDS